jgi:hypothetical protein
MTASLKKDIPLQNEINAGQIYIESRYKRLNVGPACTGRKGALDSSNLPTTIRRIWSAIDLD